MLSVMWFLYTTAGVFFWSIAIVLDSILVHNYSENPFVLMWTQSCVSMLLLPVMFFVIPFQTSYALIIGIAAVIAYAGDIVLFIYDQTLNMETRKNTNNW